MSLIDPAAGQASGIATAMLETEDLLTGPCEHARDPCRDQLQLASLTAIGVRQIEHLPARHNKCPASDKRSSGRKGNETIGAQDLTIPFGIRPRDRFVHNPREPRAISHCHPIRARTTVIHSYIMWVD